MFEGKVWWVTGASSGIGTALALALDEAGARLILSGRNEAALGAVSKRMRNASLALPFDTTEFERIPAITDRAWSWAREQGGGIFGLVNNAGISQRSLAVETAFAVYRRIVDVDLLAPIALTQTLLPRMVSAGGRTCRGDLERCRHRRLAAAQRL